MQQREAEELGGRGARGIRVAMVVSRLSASGATRIVEQLVVRMDRARFSRPLIVCVHERGPLALPDELAEVRVVGLRKAHRFDFDYVARIAGFFRDARVDLVHAHFLPDRCLRFAIAPAFRAGRLPVIDTLHSTVLQLDRGWRGHLGYRLVGRTLAALVCVSHAAAQSMAAHLRLSRERLHTIHNGIDVRALAARPGSRAAARRKLGLAGGVLVVGHVGRLSPEKGQDLLIDAFARVQRQVPESVLVVVGDGQSRTALEAHAQRVLRPGSWRFTGYREDATELLDAFDLFVLPSRARGVHYTEGLPLAPMEAMARGVPVLATAAGGTPELIADGESGRLCAADDAEALASAMVELLSAPRWLEELGAAGRRRVMERFGAERMVRAYEALYLRHAHPREAR
jgi:glycosyltransferase involved in cell wall biosynthesis